SYTSTSKPRWRSAHAAASPPMPAPITAIRNVRDMRDSRSLNPGGDISLFRHAIKYAALRRQRARVGMPRNVTRRVSCLLVAALACALPSSARAAYPERTVKIVVPFEAGGTVDTVARALADRLKTKWQVAVIVENRPGAGNIVGAQAVAKAEPDGYTLLLANTSISVNPSLYKSLPYDTKRDLAPVVFLAPS